MGPAFMHVMCVHRFSMVCQSVFVSEGRKVQIDHQIAEQLLLVLVSSTFSYITINTSCPSQCQCLKSCHASQKQYATLEKNQTKQTISVKSGIYKLFCSTFQWFIPFRPVLFRKLLETKTPLLDIGSPNFSLPNALDTFFTLNKK